MVAEIFEGETDDERIGQQHLLLARLFAGMLMAGFVMVFSLAISSGYGFGALQRLEHDVGTAHWILLVAAVPVLIVLGGPLLRSAWQDLREVRLSLNVLFTLGTTSAVTVSAISYVRGTGPIYLETAVMLLALYTLGGYLTARAKGTTAQVLRRLVELPDATYTRLAPASDEVPAEEIAEGDRIRIRAGDVIPVDGRIVDGQSYVDESSMTGEAQPVVKALGAMVYAGTTAVDGTLTVDVTAVAEKRRMDRVEQMMQRALARPPRIAQITDRILRWLIPGVVALALVTFGVWWILAGFSKALYVALSVVLITCPCALGVCCAPELEQQAEAARRCGQAALYVVEEDGLAGVLTLEEMPMPHAAHTLAALRDAVSSVSILTGDRPAAARRLARVLDVSVEAALSPSDKLDRIVDLRESHGPVAMVGDGINDAAALAEADVGIACSSGAPVSMEAADVTLYPSDLRLVAWLLHLARRTDRIIRQNLWWTFGYNAIGLGLAVMGVLHPIAAVVIMTGSSLLVTGNAFRLKRDVGPDSARSVQSFAN